MKSIWSAWRLVFAALLATLLVACKPYAVFEVSPDPVVAGKVATFDASGTMVSPTPRHNTVTSYDWDFGDGAKGTGKVATHTFATAGEYTVTLTVKDKAGKVGTATQKITVKPGDATTGSALKVLVRSPDGLLIAGAKVTAGSVSADTGSDGVATLEQAPVGDAIVVKVSKTGYVPQSLRVANADSDKAKQLFVALQPVKETQSIEQVELARMYIARSLGASVTLPANALVTTSGAPATGAATLQLTPWDIQGSDLMAMPGNGRAINDSNVEGNLISAGMMTIDFFDAAGNKLQLAAGKQAIIQMDLPLSSVNNQPLSIGSTIPLWHFNESTGLWEEDGVGEVVESQTSETGLAVRAVVGHFSTWNWDFYITEGGSANDNEVHIKCLEADGVTGVACTLVADVTLPDGSKFYHHGGNINTTEVGPEGLTIVLLPPEATIVWTGTTADGRIGTTTSGPDGEVEILMGPPKTTNEVHCALTNGTAVACDVTLTLTKADGSTAEKKVNLPATGGTVITGIESDTLSWSARSKITTKPDGTLAIYSGTATSGPSGTVNIVLGAEEEVKDKVIFLRCDTTVEIVDYDPAAPVNECTVHASASRYEEHTENMIEQIQVHATVPTGTLVPVLLPASMAESYLYIWAEARTVSGIDVAMTSTIEMLIDTITDREITDIHWTEEIPR